MVAGYQPRSEKLGYNGLRQNTPTGSKEFCEIKPRNFRTDSTAKSPKKLNGGGNFTDYSWQKFERHKRENPNMLVAGFVDGRLIYIFGFSFNERGFTFRLEAQLERRFPNGDRTGQYLRTADFSFKHYKDAKSLEIIYTTTKQELIKAQTYMTREVYKYLETTA